MKILGFIEKNNLGPWLDSVSKKYNIFLPAQDAENARIDFITYDDLQEKGNFSMNLTEKTRLSPKIAFFPDTEKFFDFEYIKDTKDSEEIGTDITISEPEKNGLPILLFGVKPCDLAGLKRLDIFYGEGLNRDSYFLERRRNSILISVGCNDPFHDCFCTSVDGHPFDFEYADIGLMEMEKGYAIVKAGEKAKKLLGESKKFISSEPADKEYEEAADELVKESEEKIRQYWKDIEKSGLSKIMDRSIKTDQWKGITAKCISCAACTYVCPTCFCFNIRDEQKGLKGERYRCWDYCMNSYYTLEASGHNPRADKSKRYRNKINCKYNYNVKRSNNLFCVGCGRCIEVCPVSVDIREVVDTVMKNDKKAPVE